MKLLIFKKIIRRFLILIKQTVIFIVSVFEVPIFLLFHMSIFRNELIYGFWHWSFGHGILRLDFVSRLYYPSRISLIFITNPRSNSYLPFCFLHNMDVFLYKSIIPPQQDHIDAPKYFVLRFFLLFIGSFTTKFSIIDQNIAHQCLSSAKEDFFDGDETSGKLIKYFDWSGYKRLLDEHIGKRPRIKESLFEQCRSAISKEYPDFFHKSFVTIVLRTKSMAGGSFSDRNREAGPPQNYIKAIQYLTRNGYHVAGTAYTPHRIFKDISGYFTLEKTDLPKELLNIFLLTNCSLYIGQHSGSYILPNSCGIPIVLCDAFPYKAGTFSQSDIVIFKHLREKSSNRRLSYVDVFLKHQDLAFGYHFTQKQITIEENSSEEILEAVKESIMRIEGKLQLHEEDKVLREKFRSIYPKSMIIGYELNCPPLFILRKLKNELLSLPFSRT